MWQQPKQIGNIEKLTNLFKNKPNTSGYFIVKTEYIFSFGKVQ